MSASEHTAPTSRGFDRRPPGDIEMVLLERSSDAPATEGSAVTPADSPCSRRATRVCACMKSCLCNPNWIPAIALVCGGILSVAGVVSIVGAEGGHIPKWLNWLDLRDKPDGNKTVSTTASRTGFSTLETDTVRPIISTTEESQGQDSVSSFAISVARNEPDWPIATEISTLLERISGGEMVARKAEKDARSTASSNNGTPSTAQTTFVVSYHRPSSDPRSIETVYVKFTPTVTAAV